MNNIPENCVYHDLKCSLMDARFLNAMKMFGVICIIHDLKINALYFNQAVKDESRKVIKVSDMETRTVLNCTELEYEMIWIIVFPHETCIKHEIYSVRHFRKQYKCNSKPTQRLFR